MRTPTEVLHDHLAKRLAGEVDADIEQNYADDTVFLTGTGSFFGKDGVRESASELAKYLGEDAEFDYRHTEVSGPYAFLEWTGTAKNKVVCDGADSYVIRDGKIRFQSIHYTTRDNK